MSAYHFLYDNPYYVIFHNSIQAALFFSWRSESAWRAALAFGNYNIALATLLAFAGSTFGMAFNYGFGFYLSRWRSELPGFSERLFQRVATVFRNRLFLIMVIPPVFMLELLPGFSLFVMVNGLFRVPPRRAIAAIAVARALYYAYYLTQPAAV